MKILLVDSCIERGALLASVLRDEGFKTLPILRPEDNLLEAVIQHQPDVVIIDLESPGRDTLEMLGTVQRHNPRPLVMFSQDDQGATIRKAVSAGVTAYVVNGLQTKQVRPLIDEAIARFEQYRTLELELLNTRQQLVQRKVIEQAKGLLMEQRNCRESDAYHLIRTQAMKQNKRMAEIAEDLLIAYALIQEE